MAEKSQTKKKAPSRDYTVQGSQIESDKQLQAALSEFSILQDKAIESNYLTWAKHNVNYDRLDDENTTANLKQANDAYTMSMLMNCASPLRQGIKASSLLQVWMSYKLISSINPSLDGDISRLCANLRQDVSSIANNLNGPLKGVAKPLVRSLDGYLANTSAQKMEMSLKSHMDDGHLDEMVMTPKQLAALKVNFMEQYYKDMRTSNRSQDDMKRDYNTAVDHLAVIAKNSGFDMSVVAAEERHLVGMKIRANPLYQNMFVETSDVYGAHPIVDDNGRWSSRFETADGHEHTVGGQVRTGAFTPRPPIDAASVFQADGDNPVNGSGDFVKNLMNRGERFAYMEMWLDGDDCPLDRKTRAQVKKELMDYEKEYKELVEHRLLDDGVYTGNMRDAKRAASRFWESTFDRAKEEAMELGPDDAEFCGFQLELHRIVDKEVLTKAGVKLKENTFANIENNVDCAELKPLKQYMEERARKFEGAGAVDVGSGPDLAVRLRENYISDMTVSEISRLMLHTGANQQQGINNPNVVGANPTRGQEIASARGIQGQISEEDAEEILNGIVTDSPGEAGNPNSTRKGRGSEFDDFGFPPDTEPDGYGDYGN